MTEEKELTPEQARKAKLLEALRAFRKRLKSTRLDEESRLGGRGLSQGRQSGIVGIQLPYGFDQDLWDELIETEKLTPVGRGLYDGADLFLRILSRVDGIEA